MTIARSCSSTAGSVETGPAAVGERVLGRRSRVLCLSLRPRRCPVVQVSIWWAEHPGELLGRASVAGDGEPVGRLGVTDRLAAERYGAQCFGICGQVRWRIGGGVAPNVDRAVVDDDAEVLPVDGDAEDRFEGVFGCEQCFQCQHQRVDTEIGVGVDGLAAAPSAELQENRFQSSATLGELVDRDVGGGREGVPPNHACALELPESLCQHVRTDPVQPGTDCPEPFRSEEQFTHDEHGPALAHDLKGASRSARVVVSTCLGHAPMLVRGLRTRNWQS